MSLSLKQRSHRPGNVPRGKTVIISTLGSLGRWERSFWVGYPWTCIKSSTPHWNGYSGQQIKHIQLCVDNTDCPYIHLIFNLQHQTQCIFLTLLGAMCHIISRLSSLWSVSCSVAQEDYHASRQPLIPSQAQDPPQLSQGLCDGEFCRLLFGWNLVAFKWNWQDKVRAMLLGCFTVLPGVF